jgi:hypothetical protein
MKRILLLAAVISALAGLSCASHNGPMERTGRAIDKAASKTVEAVGKGMDKTGEVIESGGEKLQDKAQGK